MGDDFRAWCAVCFQHVLNELNAAAWTVEFVTQQHIGRTGRRADAAMDASAQLLFNRLEMRIGQLCSGEICSHRSHVFVHTSGVQDSSRIERIFEAQG